MNGRRLLPHEVERLARDREVHREWMALQAALVPHDRRCAVGLEGRTCRCSCRGDLHGTGVLAYERSGGPRG
jgi:hypothetical protein